MLINQRTIFFSYTKPTNNIFNHNLWLISKTAQTNRVPITDVLLPSPLMVEDNQFSIWTPPSFDSLLMTGSSTYKLDSDDWKQDWMSIFV